MPVKERVAELRAEMQKGLHQLDRGMARPFDEEAVERIIERGNARLARELDAKETALEEEP